MMNVYLVGGCVRDRLLKLPVSDRDWVVVGATPNELLSQGYQQVGKDFPVFLHPVTKEEYALARTERKSGKGYTGFICDFGQEITLEQDLMRRDLTINAIAMDEKGNIVDPYHGVDDLNRKVLRHVSIAFREDPLRILRVARFAARYFHLGFVVADETRSLMQEMTASGEVYYLTSERVWLETEKALSTQNPQIYFQTLVQCGALSILFPEITLSVEIQDALKRSAVLCNEPEVRFAVLCGCLASKQSVDALCDRIKAPNSYRKTAIIVQRYRHAVDEVETLGAESIVNLLNGIDVWRNLQNLQQLICASQAYAKADSYPQADYLKNGYKIASSVDVQDIIKQGFVGKSIQAELQNRRIEAILNEI